MQVLSPYFCAFVHVLTVYAQTQLDEPLIWGHVDDGIFVEAVGDNEHLHANSLCLQQCHAYIDFRKRDTGLPIGMLIICPLPT
jgi:hypothetical protein